MVNDETPDTVKVMTHSVDMQTAAKFTVSKKLKVWLRNHPNFSRNKDSGQWTHIYEEDFNNYKRHVDEQRNRNSVPVEPTVTPIETTAEGGDDLRGAVAGEESSS